MLKLLVALVCLLEVTGAQLSLSGPILKEIEKQRRIVQGNTTQPRNGEFSVDEVAGLTRGFVDFLADFDASVVENEDDRLCVDTMSELAQAYLKRQRHGQEWYDSWGKVPAGLYYDNGMTFGNFEQCRNYRWQNVRGQHCTFISFLPNDLPVFQCSICVPDHCDPRTVHVLYGAYLMTKGVLLLDLFDPHQLCVSDRSVEYHGGVITATVIFSIIALLVLASTVYEFVMVFLEREANLLLSSFSLYRNIRSIIHVAPKSKDVQKQRDTIECINGIRALSMIWVIVVHVHESMGSIPVDNSPARLNYMVSFVSSTLWMTGYLAVDTFLALSGMLVAMSMLRELDKKQKFNPLMLYLHRYIRITAPLAALVLITVSFTTYMGEGILWKPVMDRLQDTCLKYWWSTLLHVQNYVNPDDMCLSHTWYLSVDMQLYIIAPALIYPLWRYGKRVLWVIGFLALLSIFCVFTMFIVNEFRLNIFAPNEGGRRTILTYYPTHARMSVWLWGLIFGYILHSTRKSGVNLPRKYYAFGWAACFTFLGLILYSMFEFLRTDYTTFSFVADAFFESMGRSVFAMCVMWIIFASINGHGGVVNDILSAGMWQPLAKLSYVMYLIHVTVLFMFSVSNVKTVLHFSFADILYRIWGAIGLTTTFAVFWSAIFEIPFVTLDKYLLKN
ncbi:nose resistant to fluoxetine protein 6-like [Uranotaenia lowii]|uniref:nose resistant to fluoxetine protein 6-like n=1 Tax=Uranotaenia lowii TaxID=190385 RepID=UPI0024784884|nr:nose resistant to fluoxetine protein 6-like [Uranotaenia lowii]